MKKFIIKKAMNFIRNNSEYDEVKLKEIEYGLVGIYLTFTKMFLIFSIAIILGIFKEMIIFTLIYNFIRIPSFGIHATKSWICLVASTISFLGIPYLCTILNISVILKVIILIIGIYFMFKNSPADTKKRPIVSKKRRDIYKTISTIIVIIYSFIAILTNNVFISNCIVFSIIVQNLMISPTVYKLFNLPYNNYITFLQEHPDFNN